MAQYYFDDDTDSYVWDGNDEASGYSYQISVTKQEPVFTNTNWWLKITPHSEDWLNGMEYELQFSGVITRDDRDFIRRILENEVGIPCNAVNDTIALIYELYSPCRQYPLEEIEASVRIETYYGMDRALDLSTEDLLRPTPACREAVEALEKVIIDINETRCMVCLEELSLGSEATKMPCSHVFHAQCIVKWLENRFVCPLCRFELPPAHKGTTLEGMDS